MKGVVPSTATIQSAADIGYSLVGFSNPHPPSLNIVADEFGHILMTLFGLGDREADVWVKDGSRRFTFVASERGVFEDGDLSGAEARKLTEWLGGRSRSVR